MTADPRVFAAHKSWLSGRAEREPNKRRRDAEQARIVGRLVVESFGHLPFVKEDLRMLPRAVFEAACPLFSQPPGSPPRD